MGTNETVTCRFVGQFAEETDTESKSRPKHRKAANQLDTYGRLV